MTTENIPERKQKARIPDQLISAEIIAITISPNKDGSSPAEITLNNGRCIDLGLDLFSIASKLSLGDKIKYEAPKDLPDEKQSSLGFVIITATGKNEKKEDTSLNFTVPNNHIKSILSELQQ